MYTIFLKDSIPYAYTDNRNLKQKFIITRAPVFDTVKCDSIDDVNQIFYKIIASNFTDTIKFELEILPIDDGSNDGEPMYIAATVYEEIKLNREIEAFEEKIQYIKDELQGIPINKKLRKAVAYLMDYQPCVGEYARINTFRMFVKLFGDTF